MRSLDRTLEITELWKRFVSEVEISGSLSYTDIFREAQNVLVPIFSIIFDLPDLRNLDLEHHNRPAIDLADDKARVAFQITAEGSSKKITETLTTFARHGLHQQYDRLVVYCLKRKPAQPFKKTGIVPSPFLFDSASDILDFRDILPLIKARPISDQENILELLQEEFGDSPQHQYRIPEHEIAKHQAVFVPPTQYASAQDVLHHRGIVVILGPPHLGKSQTALALALHESQQRGYGTPVRVEVFDDWRGLMRTSRRAIILDDLFGAAQPNHSVAPDRFADLLRLVRENVIVVTSRQNVFNEAQKNHRLGEFGGLEELIVTLNQEGSYSSIDLHQILQRHVEFQSNVERGNFRLTADRADLLLSHWTEIVAELRFPHNIERLVGFHAERINTVHELHQAIRKAKEIKLAAGQWFEALDRPKQTLVSLLALLPRSPQPFLDQANIAVCARLGIQPSRLSDLPRSSAGFLRSEPYVAFGHESYREGIHDLLKGTYLDDAWMILQVVSDMAADDHVMRLIECRQAINALEDNPWLHDLPAASEPLAVEQFYSRFISTYNRVINTNFPTLRASFYPGWDGDARIHVHTLPDGRPGDYIILQKHADHSFATVSQAQLQLGTYFTEVEQEAKKTTTQSSFTRQSAHDLSRSVPEVAALSDVWNQLKRGLMESGFRGGDRTLEPKFAESWHLRMARLLQSLQSAGYPIDSLSELNPMSTHQLMAWGEQIVGAARGGPSPLHLPQMRLEIQPDLGRINNLVLSQAVSDIEELTREDRMITGEFLTNSDLTWDNKLNPGSGAVLADIYTDEQLREAAERALKYHFEAYRITAERSFPTLYEYLWLYSQMPVKFTCVIDREVDHDWARPQVVYIVEPLRDQPLDVGAEVHVYLISRQMNNEDRQQSIAIRDGIWNEESKDWLLYGGWPSNQFIDLKEWRDSVVKAILDDLSQLVQGSRFG